MPIKNTNVTPNEIPAIRIFPNANPNAEINEIITTACMEVLSRNKLSNQLMFLSSFSKCWAKI